MAKSEAFEAGRSAHLDGLGRNMFENPEFLKSVEDEADRLALLANWYAGWDHSNINSYFAF